MNGSDIKKAVASKAKQAVANVQGSHSASNGSGNGGKKRRKQELKPIITTDQQKADEASYA